MLKIGIVIFCFLFSSKVPAHSQLSIKHSSINSGPGKPLTWRQNDVGPTSMRLYYATLYNVLGGQGIKIHGRTNI